MEEVYVAGMPHPSLQGWIYGVFRKQYRFLVPDYPSRTNL